MNKINDVPALSSFSKSDSRTVAGEMSVATNRRSSTVPARLLVAMVISLLAQSFSQAEESAKLPDVLKRCQAALARLKYVEYTVKGTPINEIDHPRLQLTWREEGNKLSYHFFQWQDDGTLNFQAEYSYDGLRSFNSWYGKGLYYTRIAPRPFDNWIKNVMFITVPFDFLLQTEGVPKWKQPNIELLQDQRTWERLSKDAVVLGTENRKGHECLVVRINHCVPIWEALNVYYVVYFDLKSAMPIGWKVYSEQDRLMEETSVTSEQTVMTKGQDAYLAPKQIREDFYSYDYVKQTAERTQSWVYDFSEIVTKESSDQAFGIPGVARQIFDEDVKATVFR